jgi:hypothetical protein
MARPLTITTASKEWATMSIALEARAHVRAREELARHRARCRLCRAGKPCRDGADCDAFVTASLGHLEDVVRMYGNQLPGNTEGQPGG